MKVFYGCVSKLLKKYWNIGFFKVGFIGGFKFKVVILEVVDIIMNYKDENLIMFVWEIRDRLIKERRCIKLNVLSISFINRILCSNLIEKFRRLLLGLSCFLLLFESFISLLIVIKCFFVGYSINDIFGY